MSSRTLVPYGMSISRDRVRRKIGIYNKVYTPYVEHGSLAGLGTLTWTVRERDQDITISAKNTSSTLKLELVSLWVQVMNTRSGTTYTTWNHNNWLTEDSSNQMKSSITSTSQTVFRFLCADQDYDFLSDYNIVFRISYGTAPNLRYTYKVVGYTRY